MYQSRGKYLRSSLARAMYERLQVENEMKNFDKNTWYRTNSDQYSPHMQSSFVQLNCDNETQQFLDNCDMKSDSILTQIFHTFATTFLAFFMTKTSINGFLGRGSMFVFSHQQFEKLLDISSSWKGENLLDLGAGDGKVTEIMASYFRHTSVTEASSVMGKVLTNNGYQLLGIHDWYNDGVLYDVISCLNLLDRCEQPMLILHQMASKVTPDTGRLIVAIVIPFSPYVEFGSNGTRPLELLNIRGDTFEEQVESLETNVFAPSGLEVVHWTKLPYLCEGNLQRTFYWLIDVVFILKVKRDKQFQVDSNCSVGSQLGTCDEKCSSVIVES